jgi:hypothetical protein
MMLMSAQSTSNGTEVHRSDIFDLNNEENKRRWGYEKMSKKEILDLGDQHAAWRYIL